jgi:cytidylate kinase
VPVITISRTFGSGGVPVGKELARRFGAEFLDRGIVAAIAERSGIPESEAAGYDEQLPSIWQRVAAALATSSPEISMPPLPPGEELSAGAVQERLARLTRVVIEEAAERGNAVIVGHGAAFIVGRRRDALHVHLHAPLEARVRNLVTRVEEIPENARPDEASLRELCRTVDSKRAQYIRRLFGVDWLNVSNYDLAIDTASSTIPVAADLIELAMQRRLGAGK